MLLVGLADEWVTFFPFGLLLPIQRELGLSYAQAGVVLASLTAGGILGYGFTLAADYVDRRLLASFGAAAYGLSMIVFASAGSSWLMAAAGFCWGAASDAFVHGCEVALVDLAGDDLTPALARQNTYGAVGDLLGPLTLALAAAAGWHWRAVFAAGGGVMLLYAAWLWTQRFPPPHPPAHAANPLAGVWSVLRDRRVIVLAMVDGLFGLLDEPFLGFVIAQLEQVRGLSSAIAITIAGCAVTGGLIGYAFADSLERWIAPHRLLPLASLAVVLATAAIIVAPAVPLIAVAALLFGVGGAVFYTLLQARYLALHPGQAGATTAVISIIGLLGAGFPSLVGAVADRHGLTAGLALYLAAALAMAALVMTERRAGPADP